MKGWGELQLVLAKDVFTYITYIYNSLSYPYIVLVLFLHTNRFHYRLHFAPSDLLLIIF